MKLNYIARKKIKQAKEGKGKKKTKKCAEKGILVGRRRRGLWEKSKIKSTLPVLLQKWGIERGKKA